MQQTQKVLKYTGDIQDKNCFGFNAIFFAAVKIKRLEQGCRDYLAYSK